MTDKLIREDVLVVAKECGLEDWTEDGNWRGVDDDILRFAAAMYAAGAEGMRFPEFLFDSYAVYEALNSKAKARTSPENVCDVLDAVVRLIRALPITTDTEGESHEP